jgi:hypothetical protein
MKINICSNRFHICCRNRTLETLVDEIRKILTQKLTKKILGIPVRYRRCTCLKREKMYFIDRNIFFPFIGMIQQGRGNEK